MDSDTSTANKIDAVVGYLLERHPEVGEIDPDLDLIESRILDSLDFVNFVYVLEELSGHEIALDKNSADDFRTINRIKARFFDDNVAN
jgi:acyl carrier protein